MQVLKRNDGVTICILDYINIVPQGATTYISMETSQDRLDGITKRMNELINKHEAHNNHAKEKV